MKHLLFLLSSTLLASELITDPDDVRLQLLITPAAKSQIPTQQELMMHDIARREQHASAAAAPKFSSDSSTQVITLGMLQEAMKTKNYKAMFAGVTFATRNARLKQLTTLHEAKDKDVSAVINGCNETPIHIAAQYGIISLLEGMPKEEVDVFNTSTETPLYIASWNNQIDCVRALLAVGANVNKRCHYSFTPLAVASEKGYDECVRLLLQAGANPRLKCISIGQLDTFTALWLAIQHKHATCVQQLLDAGADVNDKFKDYPVLHKAIKQKDTQSVTLLLSKKCNQQDMDGALRLACEEGYKEGVQLLIDAGINVNSDINPLWIAARLGFDDCVSLLLKAGAYINVHRESLTPLQVASKNKHNACVLLLLDAETTDIVKK